MDIIPGVLDVGLACFPLFPLSDRAQSVPFITAAEGGQHCLQVPDGTAISLLLWSQMPTPLHTTFPHSQAGKIPSFKLHLELHCSLREEVIPVSSALLGLSPGLS